MLTAMLTATLAQDSSPHMQRLALAAASREDDYANGQLLLKLAQLDNLATDVRDALTRAPSSSIREVVWSRQDATAAQLSAGLTTEKVPVVLEALFRNADGDALAEAMTGRRLTMPMAAALVKTQRFDLPQDIVRAAVLKTAGRVHIDGPSLADAGLDLRFLIENDAFTKNTRLRACTHPEVPDALVEEFFTELVQSCVADMATHGELYWIMSALARRASTSTSLIEQYRALLPVLPGRVANGAPEWERQASLGAGQRQLSSTDVTERLAGAQSPEDVLDTWRSLTEAEQKAVARQFAEHPLCSAALLQKILAVGNLRDLQCENQLWIVQREDLFKNVARKQPKVAFAMADQGGKRPWAASAADLANWSLDALLEQVTLTGDIDQMLWGKVITLPAFPRHRIGELPVGVLHGHMGVTWIVQAIADALRHLPEGDENATIAVLDAALDPNQPLTAVVAAATVAMA